MKRSINVWAIKISWCWCSLRPQIGGKSWFHGAVVATILVCEIEAKRKSIMMWIHQPWLLRVLWWSGVVHDNRWGVLWWQELKKLFPFSSFFHLLQLSKPFLKKGNGGVDSGSRIMITLPTHLAVSKKNWILGLVYILVGLACSGLEVVYDTRGCMYRR